MLLTFIFFELWGFMAAPLIAKSKTAVSDFFYIFLIATFWFSGVLFDPDKIDNKTLIILLRMNPITYLIKGYRNSFINKIWFWEYPKQMLFFLFLCCFMLLLGRYRQ